MPFPILITKEGKWFVASCPTLDIATQGKSEKEVKENMTDLITEYLNNPDTPKTSLEKILLIHFQTKIHIGRNCTWIVQWEERNLAELAD